MILAVFVGPTTLTRCTSSLVNTGSRTTGWTPDSDASTGVDPTTYPGSSGSSSGFRTYDSATWLPGPTKQMLVASAGGEGQRLERYEARPGSMVRRWASDPFPLPPAANRYDDPIIASGRDVVAVRSGAGVALVDLVDGTQRWSKAISGTPEQAAVTTGALVVHTKEGRTLGLSLSSGERLWVRGDGEYSALFQVGNAAVVSRWATGSAEYLNVEGTTGKVLRSSQPTCPGQFGLFAPGHPLRPLTGTEVVMVDSNGGDREGCAIRFDVATGQVRWRTTFTGVENHPAYVATLGENWLAMAAEDGSVLAIDLQDGAVRHLGLADGNRRAPMGIVGDSVIVAAGRLGGSHDLGEVWNARSGRRSWSRALPDGAAVLDENLHPSNHPDAVGGISWSADEVFLFGPIGSGAKTHVVQRVRMGDGSPIGGPRQLDGVEERAYDYDFDHPRDGLIIGMRDEYLAVLAPASDPAVTKPSS